MLMNQTETLAAVEPGTVTVVGLPFDANSSYMLGPAAGPARIREALHCGAANLTAENGIDLGTHSGIVDIGNAELASYDAVEQVIESIVAQGGRPLSLGGDHSITFPIMRAMARHHRDITIIQFDAHPDLYDELDGNRLAHACPFARIMEAGLATRLIQVGIRTLNQHQREQAARWDVEIISMKEWTPTCIPALNGPLYLSLDLDVLDPAFAPGVSHHEPGGLSTRDMISHLQQLDMPLIGADIVELNPHRDLVGITAMAGAKLLKELAAQMLTNY